jgi:DNA-directed RNA polymerase specialized sigma24 family protein
MAKEKSNHYVNNADFLAAIKEYKQKVKDAEESGDPKPQVSNYIGECILKIANHLSYKPNFINYSYREEMISDGIENCLMYIDNFNPERSSNPFAYFTQIIYFAFIRRIQKEKKQTLIKGKIVMDMPFEAFELQGHDDDGSYASSYVEFMQMNGVFDDIIAKDEKRKETAKAKKAAKANLDDILIETSDDQHYD